MHVTPVSGSLFEAWKVPSAFSVVLPKYQYSMSSSPALEGFGVNLRV
jgi:hypothetical protein